MELILSHDFEWSTIWKMTVNLHWFCFEPSILKSCTESPCKKFNSTDPWNCGWKNKHHYRFYYSHCTVSQLKHSNTYWFKYLKFTLFIHFISYKYHLYHQKTTFVNSFCQKVVLSPLIQVGIRHCRRKNWAKFT